MTDDMNNDEHNGNSADEFDDRVLADAARLPKSIAPERDLWPTIAAAIQTPSAGRASSSNKESAFGSWWARAAAVVLLVAGSSGLTYVTMNSANDSSADPAQLAGVNDTQVGLTAADDTLEFRPVSGSFGRQYTLGPDYQDARRSLATKLDAELDNLSPEVRDDVVANLSTIRQALDDINRSLAEEPDNALLQELLLETYRDELRLMRTVESISTNAMRRGDI